MQLEAGKRPRMALGALLQRVSGPVRPSLKGLYIWGDVGRGKTMLMDMFFSRVRIPGKRRVHFHAFMDELHDAIGQIRQDGGRNSGRGMEQGDLIRQAVDRLTGADRLLCFDEFHVSDITNAMLLGRVFERIFAKGIVVVATSNVAPDDLYRDGLNRDLFLPFIQILKEHCTVVHLGARRDYRLGRLSRQPVYHFGDPERLAGELDAHWLVLTGGIEGEATEIQVLGRIIPVPRAAMGVARFTYGELCEQPLGARDYLAISHRFHTVMVEAIPMFDRAHGEGMRRFIALIDTLYDRGVTLVAGFAVSLDRLAGPDGVLFAFHRTLSRLAEMESEAYLAQARNPAGAPPETVER